MEAGLLAKEKRKYGDKVSTMIKTAIGIDLGGTRIKAVVIDALGNVLLELYQPTRDGDDSIWKNAVAKAVKDLQNKVKSHQEVIGISAPGLSNESNSAIAYMPGRLQGLENFYWSAFLQ